MDSVDCNNMFKYLSFETLNSAGIPAVVLLAVFCLCGCGEPVPPPPTEKAELVSRFFASFNNKDVKSAMRQGVKLRSLDKHNENIIRLVEIQQCNAYVEAAQKKLNSGDVNGAIAILRKGVRLYPENVSLREMLPRVRQLRNAAKLIRGMKNASTSISMRSALTAAKIGLSLNTTPALQKFFEQYEKKITAAEVKEKAGMYITIFRKAMKQKQERKPQKKKLNGKKPNRKKPLKNRIFRKNLRQKRKCRKNPNFPPLIKSETVECFSALGSVPLCMGSSSDSIA